MPWGRRLGATFGLLALIGLCAAAMLSSYQGRYWSGFLGIQDDLVAKAETRLGELNVTGADVEANGQDLTVFLPSDREVHRTALRNELRSIDGVRGVKTVVADLGGDVDPGADVDPGDTQSATTDPGVDSGSDTGADTDADSDQGSPDEADPAETPDGRLVLRYEGYRVVVEGAVETEAGRGAVIRPANDLVGADKVIDNLQVTGGEGDDFRHAGTAGAALGRLNEWFHEATVTLTDRALVVEGDAFDADSAAAASAAINELATSAGLSAVIETGFDLAETAADAAGSPDPADVAAVNDSLAGLAVDGIEFEPDTATLDAESRSYLDALAAELGAVGPVPFDVRAHTSSLGDPDWNLLLSQERAEAVADHLAGAGIARDLITAIGLGAGEPIADDTTAEGRATNERVELVVTEGNN